MFKKINVCLLLIFLSIVTVTAQKKKKDFVSRFLPRRYDTRAATEKRRREETEDVWASASASAEERDEHAHTYNTRYQAQKRNR